MWLLIQPPVYLFTCCQPGPPASQVVLCYPVADRDAEESTADSFPSKDFSEEYRKLAGFLSSSTGAKILIYSQRQSPIQTSSEVLNSSEVSHTWDHSRGYVKLSLTFLSQGHKSCALVMKDTCCRQWFLAAKPSSAGAYVLLTFSPLHVLTMPKVCLHLSRFHYGPERSQLKGERVMLKHLQYLGHHPPEKHIIYLMPRHVSMPEGLAWRHLWVLEIEKLFDISKPHRAKTIKFCTLQTIHRQWRELNPKWCLY